KNRYRTYKTYESTVRLHILPALGRYQLDRLTPQQLQGFLNEAGKTLSPRMTKYVRDILRSALNQALRWKLVSYNAVAATEPPRVPKPKVRVLSQDDARAVLAAVRGTRLEMLVTTALALGLRSGELRGLRWSNIDLEGATLSVTHQVQRQDGEWVFVEPKSE